MRRHLAKLEAVVNYSFCPMKFAYDSMYQVSAEPPTGMLFWERMVNRALKSLAREKLRLGQLSMERTQLLWQVYTRGTLVETKAKLNSMGRDILGYFCDWLNSVNLLGLAIPKAIPIQLRERETLELTTTADLVIDGPVFIRIGTNVSSLEQGVLARDDVPWKVFNPTSKAWHVPQDSTWIPDVLSQISRGMFRNIIWANRDGRCNKCIYSSICSNEDVNSSKAEVQKRLK